MLEYIKLKNFVSHADSEIEFSEGVNVFIGNNGAGKSSVIDAITYALYGKHERGNNQNIVRNGSDGGEVILKFSTTSGKSYEVFRKFNNKGSLITTKIRADGSLLVAGDKSRDEGGVTKQIEGILGLNYNDITIASIIKQGELDAIIELKPRDIKELINRLIELDKLDKAYQEFRDVLDDFKVRLRREYGYDIADLERIEKELNDNIKNKGELERSLKELDEKLSKAENKKRKIEEEIKEQERLKSKAEQYREKRDELYRYLIRKSKEYKDKYEELLRLIKDGYEYLEIINEKGDVEQRYKELLELEEAFNRFNQLNTQLTHLEKTKNNYKRMRDDYENSIKDLEKEIEVNESIIEPEYSYEQIVETLNNIKVELANSNKRIGEIRGKLNDYNIIKDRGICPTCDREFSSIDIERKIREKAEELKQIEKRKDEYEEEIRRLEEEKDKSKRYKESRDRLKELYKELNELKEKHLNTLNQYNSIEQEIIQLKQELAQLRVIKVDAKEKKMLDDKIKRINQAEGWLEANKIKDINDIKRLEEESKALNDKIELLENIDQKEVDMLAIDDYSREVINTIKMLEEESKGYDPKKYESQIQLLKEIDNKIKALISEKGKLNAILDDTHKKIGELDNAKRALEQACRYITFYEKIREDIYHTSLPTALRSWTFGYISDKASEYLRIFDIDISNIHLREESNTIKMNCYRGSDQIEIDSLSGGEKIAVSLALRFAIASFKSNNNIDFIILDEPTIHLDQERRKELVKLIGRLARYQGLIRQIIMVTHDNEIIEDADLDNIIRFEKRGGISIIENGL